MLIYEFYYTLKCQYHKREMLKNVLRALVYVLFLEIFYEKIIKQLILMITF